MSTTIYSLEIGGHGSLNACVAPGISIQSLTQSLWHQLVVTHNYCIHLIKIYSRTGIHVLLRTVECNDVKKN